MTRARVGSSRALRALDFEVTEVNDGGRMLVAIAAQYKDNHTPEDVDLVITDVRMPVLSGLEVLKGIRKAHWRTPVIVMTAFASAEVHEVVGSTGAVLFEKPVDLDELEATVQRLLDSRRKIRQFGQCGS